jgi:predicted NBD/HSP70 family sugar kinase
MEVEEMNAFDFLVKPRFMPPLDKDFRPASLANRFFLREAEKSGNSVPLAISLERTGGLVHTYRTKIFADESKYAKANLFYAERLVKTLLWQIGGWKITIGGPEYVGRFIKDAYSKGGSRDFDLGHMTKVYERPIEVVITSYENVRDSAEETKPIGRHLDGCRIGFDAGGSDRKVSAVIDGNAVYSEEVIWHPKINSDPEYHYNEILTAMKTAASKMPRVDAIGVSSAGIYVDNRIMVASLFMKVPQDLYDAKVKDMYINIAREMGNVPIEVANDGDVTALAGAMDLDDTNVLGLAMGTSEAGGFIDGNGNITGWLNELAFIPVDFNPGSAVDEWSGDYGCGVKYFSQDAVIKLAPAAGIELDEKLTPAEKLKTVQELHERGHEGAAMIFESIGCYLGYALAHYADFYDIRHVLILGRVTSGAGGNIILRTAENVLAREFPELGSKITLHLPDENNRRVGQSIAAASLPALER